MKRLALITMLALLTSVAWGQSYVITPDISTKAIPTIVTKPGNDTISAAAKPFGSVTVGMNVYGVGVPEGTKVLALVNADLDSQLVLTNAITQGGSKTLSFGYYVNTTYSSGDWLGQPFKVYSNPGVGGEEAVVSVAITDIADCIGSVDLVFFNAWCDSLGLDSAAIATPAAYGANVVGVVNLTATVNDLGGCRTIEEHAITLAVPRDALYGRLIAKAAIGPTTVVNPFKIRIGMR